MGEIVKQNGIDLLQDGMMSFSAYTLLHRAIPSLEDGLKVSYRRIIYAMYKNKVFNYTKSLNVVGEVAKIHPHGSVYPTMVGMAQKDRHIMPFIDGKGYFGDYTSRDVEAAADRYTNVKLPEFSKNMLKNLNKNSVKLIKTYDGVTEVPEYLPVNFPNILSFAQSGMGVGFSSSTASFNIGDISDAVIYYLEKGKHKNLIPDFATGGTLLKDEAVIDTINKDGKGSIKIRAKAEIRGKEISILEIPYSTTREAIIDKVVELAKTDKLKEVVNIQDLTGLEKMEILITARRGTDMELLLEKLYQITPLESSYSVNSVVLDNGLPKLLGVHSIIERWIEWRKGCIVKELSHDISRLDSKLFEIRILEKLREDHIKKLINIIRQNKNKTDAIQKIRKLNDFTYKEANFLYDLRINQLNTTYIQNKIVERNDIEGKIKELEQLQTNPSQVIIQDMKEFKSKFNSERRTEIVDIDIIEDKRKDVIDIIKQDLVDSNDYWITITKNHYLYKTERKSIKLKNDSIVQQFKLNNVEDEVFVYTHSRQGYKLQIRDLEVYTGSGLGDYAPVKLGVEKEDIISYGVSSKYYPIIILLLTSGRIVKFDYEAYRAGVNVFANTHTDRYNIFKVIFSDKEIELDLTDNEGEVVSIRSEDIRFTKNRTGSGQFIHPTRRNNITKFKIR